MGKDFTGLQTALIPLIWSIFAPKHLVLPLLEPGERIKWTSDEALLPNL